MVETTKTKNKYTNHTPIRLKTTYDGFIFATVWFNYFELLSKGLNETEISK
jgi:hypothetical protein